MNRSSNSMGVYKKDKKIQDMTGYLRVSLAMSDIFGFL